MARAPKESNTLISAEGSGYFYVNRKNRKKSKGDNKLKLKKYDPVARKHVLFEEKKLSKLKKKYKPGQEGQSKPKKEKATEAAA
jgi:large subunit ribosomal protein L33